jgi:hypothetical protein
VAFGSLANVACVVQLFPSDKEITAINGGALTPDLCNHTSGALPASVQVKKGDILSYAVNVCNVGDLDATSISITDHLVNLQQPPTDANHPATNPFNACFADTSSIGSPCLASTTIVSMSPITSCPPTAGKYCVQGSPPSQTIIFNLTNDSKNRVLAHSQKSLTFDAQIPSTATVSSQFQNWANIVYNAGNLNVVPPLQRFSAGPSTPIIIEKP